MEVPEMRIVAIVLALIASTQFAARTALAACPANGNTHALYVTLNNRRDILSLDSNGQYVGGVINFTSIPSDVRLAKLRAMIFGVDGNLYVSSAMSELSRVFVLSGQLNIDCSRNYLHTFQVLNPHTNPLMDHPYDIKFLVNHDRTGSIMFVSNQNTATVTRYCGPRRYRARKSSGGGDEKGDEDVSGRMPPRSADLSEEWGLDGAGSNKNMVTIPKCTYGEPIDPPKYLINGLSATSSSPVVKAQQAPAGGSSKQQKSTIAFGTDHIPSGAFVISSHAKYHLRSVRGLAVYVPPPESAWKHVSSRERSAEQREAFSEVRRTESKDGPLLIVCDIDGSEVLVFSATTGEFLWSYHHRISFPVQIVIPTSQFASTDLHYPYMYVTTKTPGTVFKAQLGRTAYVVPLMTGQGFQYTSGLVEIAPHNTLLIADRGASQIAMYGIMDSGNEAVSERMGLFGRHTDLGDHPEHMMYVRLVDPQEIPFCYELGSEGLKKAPLCTAVNLWMWAVIIVVGVIAFREVMGRSRGQGKQ